MAIDYKTELNECQYEAVAYTDGPQLVIAGAGSGKTRVLTYKIAYLLEQGMAPWNILALTFTNKAAREMQERIAGQVGKESADRLWMGTFHSIFSRILRTEAKHLGFTSSYTIYDQADSRNLLKTLIKEMGLDEKTYKPTVVQHHISLAKNRLIAPEAYIRDAQVRKTDEIAGIPLTGEIYRRYCQRCRLADAMDFDDLLFNTYLLFEEHPDVCARYAERFQYVLVDEYQDTNYAQHKIVWQLTGERQRICAVGDDAQSIYSFRGASVDNILKFCEKYAGARLFKLEQNYRSTKNIVAAANSLIDHNRDRIEKSVFSENAQGAPVAVYGAYSDIEEADIVVNKIAELRRVENMEYTDFVILYRTNSQSRSFEEALRKRSMPYRIYGGLSFYQRKEVKDAIAYFRLVVNPNDEEAFKRIVNYPARGIGQTTLEKIGIAASENEASMWAVACEPETFGVELNKGTCTKLRSFCTMIEQFRKDVLTSEADVLAERVLQESGLVRDIFQNNDPENVSRQENIQELMGGLNEFVAGRKEEGRAEECFLSDFLQEVSLLSDLDEDKGGDDSKVTLMTVHSAKGLEFRVVFVVGLEENLFPNQMAMDSMCGLEEERRLFYVALTRAEERCFLTYALSRYRFGKTEFGNPSRFLKEIDARYLKVDASSRSVVSDMPSRSRFSGGTRMEDYESSVMARRVASVSGLKRVAASPVSRPAVLSSLSSSTAISSGGALVQVGQTIEHERFGVGRVLQVEGNGENTKATVEFQHSGKKQLLLRFARFKIVK